MKYVLLLAALLTAAASIAQDDGQKVDTSLNAHFKTVKWRNIGPFRGGRSVCATGVPGDILTYYMGTTGGGLWKTTDAGQHWRNISDGFFKTGSVGAVAVAPSNPHVVYCGMGEHAPRGVMTSHGDGVYKSLDGGKTWQHIGLKETQHIARIVIHPSDPDIAYVAAQGQLYGRNEERGIFKTVDGGENWEKILYVDDRTGCSELAMDPVNPRILYATMWEHQRLPWQIISGGPGSGVYKSTDGGKTWKTIHEGLPDEKGKMAIDVCPSNPDKLYAVIESDSQKEKGGLFVSKNAGKSWTKVSSDHRLVQRAWYYTEVFADPNNENVVYVLSAPALRSIDGGKTWERVSGTHGDFHDLWINPDNSSNLCIANDGGAAISFDQGENWSTQFNMPTAQFYRISVDNHFPYRIYGGQQDNSSVRIDSRAFGSSGIWGDGWTESAGGESAFLAFDPDDPRYVMGGSYLGTVEIMDMDSKASTNVMAAPRQYLGLAASDMHYRYNWNAPTLRSMHEPNTYYHAAQYLLRTRDMGKTWEEVSPVLSRDEKDKQVKGGAPYTVEAVGAENYGTISYVIESPHEAGVIWTGSDDGKVFLTRDNCVSWNDVTPAGLEPCLVNAIDVSPHDPATAYIATTRYKFNDHTPALYKTSDYGTTWTNISSGIPYGAYTRVVREDKSVRGLLYAGTETGVYVSHDDGASWKSLQLNLPVTPITDLCVHQGDLIAATSGRSFWILDDLGLVGQYDVADDSDVILYRPEPAMLVNMWSALDKTDADFDGMGDNYGINPASGSVIYYTLPEIADSVDIAMDIRDSNGNIIRSFSSKKGDSDFSGWDGGPPSKPRISKETGLNRFVWDLRHDIMPGVKDVYIEGSYRTHKVVPGTYTIALTVGDQVLRTECEVKPNPLYDVSMDEYREFASFMSEMESNLTAMHELVNAMDKARKSIETLKDDMLDKTDHADLESQAVALIEKMKTWDGEMVQRKSKAYDDVENFENKFTANYLFLINQTDSSIPRVNASNREVRAEYDEKWRALEAQARALIENDVPEFNKALWDSGIGAIAPIKPAIRP